MVSPPPVLYRQALYSRVPLDGGGIVPPVNPRSARKPSPGSIQPLGATLTPEGVNFALFSRNAREVHLLLFDNPAGEPTDVIRVENQSRFIWHVLVHGLKAGQLYGYRVMGDHDRRTGCASTPTSFSSTPTPRRSPARP